MNPNPNFRIIDERSQTESELISLPQLPFFMEEPESKGIYMVSSQFCTDCGEEHYLVTYMVDGTTLKRNYTRKEIAGLIEEDTLLSTELIVQNTQQY